MCSILSSSCFGDGSFIPRRQYLIMVDETGLKEYASSIASSTAEMVAVTDALKDALVAVLANEEDCAVAIASAKETRDALIRDTYRTGLVPFMQPAAAGEPVEGGADEPAAESSDDEAAAESDEAAGGGGRRR